MEAKTLIVGATSDLSISYLNSKKNKSKYVLLLRNLKKLKKSFFEDEFSDVIELDLSKLSVLNKTLSSESNNYNNLIFFNGIDVIKPIQFYSTEELIKSFNINIISIFSIISTLLKKKLIINNSSIVIVSSISGNIIGSKGHSLYSTTKSAISGLVKSFSIELSKKNIRVNAILPGLIQTENLFNKNEQLQTAKEFEVYQSRYPLGLGKPKNINDLIDFLISDKSSWITGQNIIIDGGHTLLS